MITPEQILAIASAMLCADRAPAPTITVVSEPKHTTNLFGPITEIAGKELAVMDRNREGDCLCVFDGVRGQNLVDVDHRDIA
jgi:hypothetical protein